MIKPLFYFFNPFFFYDDVSFSNDVSFLDGAFLDDVSLDVSGVVIYD